jgi:phosphatidylglycerophosphate synthase
MDGRKLPQALENPVDSAFIAIIERIHPAFKALHFTPNAITCLSGILQFAAAYNIYTDAFITAGALYAIGYFFDVMDGWYARYYGMTSPLGDWLDHTKDVCAMIAVYGVVVLHPRIPRWLKVAFVTVTAGLYGLMMVFLSCQEKVYVGGDSARRDVGQSLTALEGLCDQDTLERISVFRWFGPGTGMLAVVAFMPIFATSAA